VKFLKCHVVSTGWSCFPGMLGHVGWAPGGFPDGACGSPTPPWVVGALGIRPTYPASAPSESEPPPPRKKKKKRVPTPPPLTTTT
jgi:hypothetical protein